METVIINGIDYSVAPQVAEFLQTILKERDDLITEIEQLRVQLAGCGVAAMQNTPDSIKNRAVEGDYGYSASYADVCEAVNREMHYRDTLEKIVTFVNRHAV